MSRAKPRAFRPVPHPGPPSAACKAINLSGSHARAPIRLPDLQTLLLDRAAGSATAPETGKVYGWQDAGLACVPCQSDCGCADSTICQEGFCVPGYAPADLVCCGREQETDCPNGTACTQLDGTQSTCQTVARCEPCEADINCETGACVTVAPGLEPVCMSMPDRLSHPRACRDGDVWNADACDRWVEIAISCADGTHCEGEVCVADARGRGHRRCRPSEMAVGQQGADASIGNRHLCQL